MSVAGGPNIERGGLVFGYDTGYGIADNDTSTRFYPGKPTTNEISDANLMSGWSPYSNGNDGTFTTEFGTVGYKIDNKASWNGLLRVFTLPNPGTYTFSALFRYRGGSSSNNGATVYISGWGGGDTATAIDKSKVNEWQRIEKTISVTNTTLRFYIISYGGSGAVSSWDVTMPQIEQQSTRSPFLTGTRSSTQSLIDLTKSTNIDVSNISFDSTGQPEFDGTNDVITTSFPATTIPNVTIEAVVYRNQATNRYEAIVQNNIVSDDALYVNPSGYLMFWPCASSTLAVPTGQWSHVAVAYNGTTLTYILNGTVQVVTASCSHITDWDFLRMGGHSTTDGERWIGKVAVAKVYEKSLSAAELTQNYNAYKNRFNI